MLLPVTNVTAKWLTNGRTLIRLVSEADKEEIKEKWGHSSHIGRLGVLAGIEDKPSPTISRDTALLVRRTIKAREVLRYPAFALRIIATREEIEALELTKQQRKETQPVSYDRLKATKEWAKRLFPKDKLIVNDRHIAVTPRLDALQQPSRWPEVKDNLWYPETLLLFDQMGTKTNSSQLAGLKKYGPFDYNSKARTFQKIRPYLIVPNQDALMRQANCLLQFLASGYQKRSGTDFIDDDFGGITPNFTFRAEFVLPEAEDIIRVEDNPNSYLDAANKMLQKWIVQDGKSEERIVIAVVPGLYSDENANEDNDPYIGLKKILIEGGLPSQMIAAHNLKGTEDITLAYGHLLWNFALSIYVKLGGRPWTLHRPMGNVNCLIGIGFGRDKTAVSDPLYVGAANVFDEHGQWLSLSSDDRLLTEEQLQSIVDREYDVAGTNSYKLHHELTSKIVGKSLNDYMMYSQNQSPTRVVLHKNGKLHESEAVGFLQALATNIANSGGNLQLAKFALVAIYKNHDIRMYGPDYQDVKYTMRHTISRGSARILNKNTAVLATTGKTAYTYPGIGTPRPLIVERYVPTQSTLAATGLNEGQIYPIEEICEQILSLTKLHWGATRNIRLPVTSEYAQRIARFVAISKVRVDLLLKWKKLWWV